MFGSYHVQYRSGSLTQYQDRRNLDAMAVRSILVCIVVLVSTSSALSQLLRGRSSGLDLQRLLLSSLIDRPDRPDTPDRKDLSEVKDSPEVKFYTIRANNPIIINRGSSGRILPRGLVPSSISSLGLSSRGLLSSGLLSSGLMSSGLVSSGLASSGLSSRNILSSDIGSQYRTLKLLGLL
ncbi:uncharacterized protein [Argopecten irradians]|uniref:uncharacterized protein n=1 Tax=Argopecten irradians TaxID=31199 RepID=UPI003713C106